MFRRLVDLANKLDQLKYYNAADEIDHIILITSEKEYSVSLPEIVENIRALKANIIQTKNEIREINLTVNHEKTNKLNILRGELSRYEKDFLRHMKYLRLLRLKYPEIYKKIKDIEKMTPEQIQRQYYSERKMSPVIITHKIEED